MAGLPGSKVLAWTIHLFTMSGVVLGIKALQAIGEGKPRAALLWMMAAMVVDGIDGPLARAFEISKWVPILDGNSLDLMIDFLACVVAPAAFVHKFGLLPNSSSLLLAGVILISGVIWMARTDMLTFDDYFVGFPAMWNIIVTIMYILGTNHTMNTIFILFFAAISFTRIKFVHPMRTRDFRWITIPLMTVWLAVQVYLVVHLKNDNWNANGPRWAKGVVIAGGVYHGFLVVRRTRMNAPNITKQH